MHKWQISTSTFVLLFVCNEVTAGYKENVLATMDAIMTAWTTGDIDTVQKHLLAEADRFASNGGLFSPIKLESARAAFAAGYKLKVQRVNYETKDPSRWNPLQLGNMRHYRFC